MAIRFSKLGYNPHPISHLLLKFTKFTEKKKKRKKEKKRLVLIIFGKNGQI